MRVKRLHDQRVAAGACFVAAVFLNIIDTTIVNVALPAIGHDLDVPLTSTNAVVVSYLVALAIAIPVGGWLGDRFGPKRVYIASVGLFALASALCGLAQSLDQLVLFRVLQGLGGGIQTPVAMALLYRVYTPSERVRAARVLVLPTSFAPALGPLVGGALVDTLGWRWVFLVNVPIGVATVVFAGAFLASGRGVHPGRFDAVGFVLAGLGLGLVTYGLSGAPAGGWTSVPILASLVAGIVCLERSWSSSYGCTSRFCACACSRCLTSRTPTSSSPSPWERSPVSSSSVRSISSGRSVYRRSRPAS